MASKEPTLVAVLSEDRLRKMLVEAGEEAARRVLEERRSIEWLSKGEVARMLGYKESYVPELVQRRGLPCRRVGRKFRFLQEEVEAWARENAVTIDE